MVGLVLTIKNLACKSLILHLLPPEENKKNVF